VREATDAALAAERPALTDEEWLAALSGAGPVTPPAREALASVLARCGSVKYAGERPTDWSAQETFTAARRALELVGARAPAGEGQP
jgi:hypothetical protein